MVTQEFGYPGGTNLIGECFTYKTAGEFSERFNESSVYEK
jgi:hypothetical protein